jgi:2-polyprenyl-3-methyl-5-hydroxy-6-metoxy-1,4-benzoquinol methylase
VRRLVKAIVPLRWRRAIRHEATHAPQRVRDLPADLVCLVRPRAFGGPLPPHGLRARVGDPSRAVYRRVGVEGRAALLAAFDRTRDPGRAYPAWLDFGCGSGRLAHRMIDENPPVVSLHGVDVDEDLVRWARTHLRGVFETMRPDPPLAFPDARFDVVYATSIFTHYTESEQFAWLAELARVLKPGGVLLATTISPQMAGLFSGISEADYRQLGNDGFFCANPTGAFNARAAFHSRGYLERAWERTLRLRLHEPQGFVNFQDLSVWEKPSPAEPR